MSSDAVNSWALIQQGVRDTERLIGQKQYNTAMVKARQTLEQMVKQLAGRNNIQDGDLMDMIDELYRKNVISKTTCEHYHKIRVIGNKAVHDDDNNAYNASTAYHLLSQEVYVFANDYASHRHRARSGPEGRESYSGDSRSRSRGGRQEFSAYSLLKILVPILAIVLVIAIVRMVKPGSKKAAATTAAAAQTTSAAMSTQAPTTSAPVPTTAAAVYKTTSSLNVRSAPSKDGDKLATLPAGTVVDYVKAYDGDWAVINYNGSQAYVASQFLEAGKPAAETTAAGAAKTKAATETTKAASQKESTTAH